MVPSFTLRLLTTSAVLLIVATSVLAQSPEEESAPVKIPYKGFLIESENGAHQLRVGGHLQIDTVFFLEDEEDTKKDEFVLRRIRPRLSGKVFNDFHYGLLIDFAGEKVTLLDAWLDYRPIPEFSVRIGKQKAPFDTERLQSPTAILFYERALPTSLGPNRDVGVMIHGNVAKGTFSYALGGFNGVADGASGEFNLTDDFELVGRIFANPFRPLKIAALNNLGLGVAASWGHEEGSEAASALSSYRTGGRTNFFKYASGTDEGTTAFADGTRLRLSGQGTYTYGPLSLLGTFTQSTQAATLGDKNEDMTHQAWVAAATFVATLEDASFKGVSPEKPFDPANGQWGSVELGVRFAEHTVDDAVFDENFASISSSVRKAQSLGAVVNWYLNDSIRFLLGYEWTQFEGGQKEGADKPDEHFLHVRAQLNLDPL